MNQKKLPVRKQSMAEVERQFQIWRSSRKKGAVIPQSLWKAAVELSSHHTLSAIAKVLRLDYVKLKEQAGSSRGMKNEQVWRGGANSAFVEVGVFPEMGSCEWQVEMEDGCGRRLKLRLRGSSGEAAVEIARVLWAGC